MRSDPMMILAGVVITLALIGLAGYIVARLAHTPARIATVIIAVAILIGAVPALLTSLGA